MSDMLTEYLNLGKYGLRFIKVADCSKAPKSDGSYKFTSNLMACILVACRLIAVFCDLVRYLYQGSYISQVVTRVEKHFAHNFLVCRDFFTITSTEDESCEVKSSDKKVHKE
jgi:hypothetical protein